MTIDVDRDDAGNIRLHFGRKVHTLDPDKAAELADAIQTELATDDDNDDDPRYAQIVTRTGGYICLDTEEGSIEFSDPVGYFVTLTSALVPSMADLTNLITALCTQKSGEVLYGSNEPDGPGYVEVTWTSGSNGAASVQVEGDEGEGAYTLAPIVLTSFERAKWLGLLQQSNAAV